MGTPHELILLTPYRFPAQSALTLANEDMASWLNAWTVLWHPAVLWQAKGPPRCESPYDHEQPRPNCVYAVPESPPSYLPDDWDKRVREAGSIAFKAMPDRTATVANLQAAMTTDGPARLGWAEAFGEPAQATAPFYGLAWGHLMLAALSEAMEHENLLDPAAFWDDVQYAVARLAGQSYTPASQALAEGAPAGRSADHVPREPGWYAGANAASQVPDAAGFTPATLEATATAEHVREGLPPAENHHVPAWRRPLESAAARLLSAREVLYPVVIHLLDLHLVDATGENAAGAGAAWLAALAGNLPVNLVACTRLLEQLAEHQPAHLEQLRAAVQAGHAEICGGPYVEREDPLLPLDSQLWNLRHGLDRARALLGGGEVRVFARRRFGFHPQTPLFLSTNGVTKALFLTFDESAAVPTYNQCVVSWPSPDGKQVDAFVRTPKPADSPETFFNLGHSWFKTTREDHAATLCLLHRPGTTAPWYQDLLELHRLAPVLGTWETFSTYFTQVYAGEYPPSLSADEFHYDYLTERINAHRPDPVSGFAQHLRMRRRLDACWTYAALNRSLAGARDSLAVEQELRGLELALEGEANPLDPARLEPLERRIAAALADRLQARAQDQRPGYLLLNPCGFARRAVLELGPASRPLPVGGAVKACQLDGDQIRAVVEVPALGFCWLPREGPPGTAAMPAKLRLGDQASNTIRNEFFEAEVDPVTGGLKAIRDYKSRINRIGQQLVFNPGSRMVVKDIRVTSAGPALGEIVSEGVLIGDQDQVLASYRQRLRAWMGRPLLEMRIELEPTQPPAGYAWHAYYGARFAWREERAALFRSINGSGFHSTHPRPQTPDYLEIRLSPQSTAILTGGLPFHQKQGSRMVDVILVPEGEKVTTFDLGIVLDRDQPIQTALGYASPLAIVPTTKGPPHIGAAGWLFHVDASNLLLTRLVPGKHESRPEDAAPAPTPADAITARFLECANYSGFAEFRCVRDPQRALILDARGQQLVQANHHSDVVNLEVSPNDLVHVQVEFS
jgi:hypothetical protein